MALLDHESFPQPSDPSELVWRYMDTPKLLSLLLRQALFLGRVDLFPDKYEGTHTRPTREALLRQLTSPRPTGTGLGPEQARHLAQQMIKAPRLVRKMMYASCWCLLKHESEAMWRLYSGTGEGVALVLPYSRLKESLTDPVAFVGTMTYIDYGSEFIQLGNMFNYVMHKRREFQHEREVRIVRMAPDDIVGPDWETKLPASLALPWVAKDHVQSIVVSPYAAPWYLDTIRETVARVSPGLEDRVVASTMGGDPLD